MVDEWSRAHLDNYQPMGKLVQISYVILETSAIKNTVHVMGHR